MGAVYFRKYLCIANAMCQLVRLHCPLFEVFIALFFVFPENLVATLRWPKICCIVACRETEICRVPSADQGQLRWDI